MSRNKNKLNLQSKECFSRMNFLYQASMLMAGKNNTLSSYYGQLCRNIGKRSVLRIEPDVKRDFCKRCSLAQKPGLTSELNVDCRRGKKKKLGQLDKDAQIKLICKLCGYRRNFNINTEYKFWLENPQSVAEILTIKTDKGEERANDKNGKTKYNTLNNNCNANKL